MGNVTTVKMVFTTESNVSHDTLVFPVTTGPHDVEAAHDPRPTVQMHVAENQAGAMQSVKDLIGVGADACAKELATGERKKRAKSDDSLARSLITANVDANKVSMLKAALGDALPVGKKVNADTAWSVRLPTKPTPENPDLFVDNFDGSTELSCAEGIAGVQWCLVWNLNKGVFRFTPRLVWFIKTGDSEELADAAGQVAAAQQPSAWKQLFQ